MPIDVLGVVLASYLLTLLTAAMLFGMSRVRGYGFVISLQALIILFSYLMANNLSDGVSPRLSLVDGVELAMLLVAALALFAIAFLKHSRGERLGLSFNTHLLGGATLYLFAKLLATFGLYARLPAYTEAALYLLLALGFLFAVYTRARRTRFL